MRQIRTDAEALPSSVTTLGRSWDVHSRVTVGISDVFVPDLPEGSRRPRDGSELLGMTMRLSFRPAPDELLERVLFSVLLQNRDERDERVPVAFALEPQQLVSGAYTTRSGVTFGARAGTSTTGLSAEASQSVEMEIRQPFVTAAGEGESDPEWRYRRTKTKELEGAHEMAMLVELDPEIEAEAFISLSGTVTVNRTSIDVVWELDDTLARVPLVAVSSRDGS